MGSLEASISIQYGHAAGVAVGPGGDSIKDPYPVDFPGLGDEAQERDIEHALVRHVTQFLLELSAGFAFVGRQVPLDVGGDEFLSTCSSNT